MKAPGARISVTFSRETIVSIVSGALGFAAPLIIGVVWRHPAFGTVVALAALAFGGGARSEPLGRQIRNALDATISVTAATFVGTVMAKEPGFALWATPFLAAIIGLIGGVSRRFARSCSQFIVFMVIVTNVTIPSSSPLSMALLVLAGALWSGGLTLSLSRLFPPAEVQIAPPVADYRKLYRRWIRALREIAGWQYAIRIASCLFAAELYKALEPGHHGYWALVTVAIVVHRSLAEALGRALERAAGTIVGVLVISLLAFLLPALWEQIVMIAIFAGLRPLYRETNYTAYAAVMTPLVILLLDFQQRVSAAVVIDRFTATIAGCAIALVLGYVPWMQLASAQRVAAKT